MKSDSTGIGQAIERREDHRLVSGQGCFVGDMGRQGDGVAVIVRSPYAAARLVSIDTEAATTLPGVLAVVTGRNIRQAGLGGIPWEVCPPPFQEPGRVIGDPAVAKPQPLLATDRVRYVGEPVAMVVATDLAVAQDAAELIDLTVEEEPAVTNATKACSGTHPALWAEYEDNVLFRHRIGKPEPVDDALATADHVIHLSTHIPRLNAAPIEPRCYRGSVEADTGRYVLEASAGKPHPVRNTLAKYVFGIEPDRIHVVAPDIGGGFGAKNVAHAEAALVLFGARLTGRPVVWTSTRSDSFQSDMQGRDHRIEAALAFDDDGRFRALRYESTVNLGAYLAPRGVIPCLSGSKVLTGPYRIPAGVSNIKAVFTNTVPTCPYRGAGVPETAFVVERLVDMAARKLGRDPADIRALNLIRPQDLPYVSASGTTIHSTDFPAVLKRARQEAGWDAARTAKPDAAGNDGLLRGIGMAYTIEAYGTAYEEGAEVSADGDGRITIAIGTKSGGQSHETTYTQVAASALGVPAETVDVIQGDTDRIRRGHGTGASRSMTTGGSAIWKACQRLTETARPIAAELLQCKPETLAFDNGAFRDSSNPAGPSVTLAAVAKAAPGARLEASGAFQPEQFNVPGGCHIAEVTVDPDTGVVTITRYLAVHDCGQAINPTVVKGQLAGGIAQGVGAALGERIVFDADDGQLLTGSFMDYAVPRAPDLPDLELHLQSVRCTSNLLGAKAVGEAGPVAAPPAVVNAIVDALAPLGITHVDLPATPSRLWQAIQDNGVTPA